MFPVVILWIVSGLCRLTRSEGNGRNWITTVTHANGRSQQLHINFCRPILPSVDHVSDACEPMAGSCLVEVTDTGV